MDRYSPFLDQDNFIFSLSIIFLAFLAALALTERVRRSFLQRAILDIPNDRSSHRTPVPRGGGWALLAILIPAAILPIGVIDGDMKHVGLACSILLLAAISWLDDRKHINPAIRLGCHILAAYLGTLSFAHDETLFHGAIPFWADRALTVLGWAWFVNLYNFMDGIDGITSVETVAIAVGFSIAASAAGIVDLYANFLCLVLVGLALGFLAHNWHPAKIFLGDVGSVPLGYMTGFLLLTLALKGHPAAALTIPLYYLADSGITIARRAAKGKKIWQAHREHFYQTASIRAGCHDRVVTQIVFADIGLILAAALAVAAPGPGLAAGALIVALLLVKLHNLGPVKKKS